MNDLTYAAAVSDGLNRKAGKNFELIYCSARGELIFDGQKQPFERGDVLLIPPLLPCVRTGVASGDLHFFIERAVLPVKQPTVFPYSSAKTLTDTCRLAATHHENGGDISAFGGLIAALIVQYSGGNGYSPVVKTVIADIEKNLNNSVYSLEDELHSLPLNYDYIRKLFKKETGETPARYLLRSRMELAKNILLSGVTNQYSNFTVSQVAEACGFAEPLYFTRVFKKYFGVPPTDFRRGNANILSR